MTADARLAAYMTRLFGSRNMQIDRLPLIGTLVGRVLSASLFEKKLNFPGSTGMDYVLGGRVRWAYNADNTVTFSTEGERKRIAERIIEEAALLGWHHQGKGVFARVH